LRLAIAERLYRMDIVLGIAELLHGKCFFPIDNKACRRINLMSLKNKRKLLAVVRPRCFEIKPTAPCFYIISTAI
jgi:hypothetical protein